MSLGHAAFLGIGGYVAVLATGDRGGAVMLWLLPASISGGALRALRRRAEPAHRGVYFIMVTLAFAQMAYFVFHDIKLGGGSDGIFPLHQAGAGGRQPHAVLDLDDKALTTRSSPRSSSPTAAGARRRARASAYALAGIRINEQRMRAAGLRNLRLQVCRVRQPRRLAGLMAGEGRREPELLSWHQSGAVLLMIIPADRQPARR